MKELEQGEYRVPDGYVVRINKGARSLAIKPSQRLLRTMGVEKRCRDCKHFGEGKSIQKAWFTQYVCYRKPKTINGDAKYHYCAVGSSIACDMFEQKED